LIFNFHAVQSAVMGSNTAVEAKHTDSRGRATREDLLGCHPPEPRSILIHVADVDQALEGCRSSPGLVEPVESNPRGTREFVLQAPDRHRFRIGHGEGARCLRDHTGDNAVALALLNRVIAVMVGMMSPHPKRLPLGAGPATRLAGTRART
jgi:hypothetical protein